MASFVACHAAALKGTRDPPTVLTQRVCAGRRSTHSRRSSLQDSLNALLGMGCTSISGASQSPQPRSRRSSLWDACGLDLTTAGRTSRASSSPTARAGRSTSPRPRTSPRWRNSPPRTCTHSRRGSLSDPYAPDAAAALPAAPRSQPRASPPLTRSRRGSLNEARSRRGSLLDALGLGELPLCPNGSNAEGFDPASLGEEVAFHPRPRLPVRVRPGPRGPLTVTARRGTCAPGSARTGGRCGRRADWGPRTKWTRRVLHPVLIGHGPAAVPDGRVERGRGCQLVLSKVVEGVREPGAVSWGLRCHVARRTCAPAPMRSEFWSSQQLLNVAARDQPQRHALLPARPAP